MKDSKKIVHLAGIVPVAGFESDFNFLWHDCCMPIAPDYLAIERSVLECAYAGCETIWIVCNDDMQPLIRYRLGDYVNDPVWVYRPYDYRSSESKKQIPIFYVPIHPKDRDKRDCLSWSVLYGASSAYSVSARISKWSTPGKYYVSFPYAVYPVEFLREHRTQISNNSNFCLTYEGKSVKNNNYMGFSFGPEDFKKLRKCLRDKGTGAYTSNLENGMPREKLPIADRYSARFFDLSDVFGIYEPQASVELPWYHAIDNWENYCSFMSSTERNEIKTPSKDILAFRELNRIGQDNTED